MHAPALLATLAWLKATSQPRRGIWLGLLAFSLAAAVGSHYYAVIPAACLGLGELARTRSRRRLDVPVWIAFAFTVLPIVLFAKTIGSARSYSAHFWAAPVWSDAVRFFEYELAMNVVAIFGTVVFLLLFGQRRSFPGSPGNSQNSAAGLTDWQATALAALALLPLLVMVLAKYVTHGFADRYAISALVGVAVLCTYSLYRLAPAPQISLAAVLACLGMYTFQVHSNLHVIKEVRARTASDIAYVTKTGGRNIAMMELTQFHRLSFYAPRSTASRLAYIADPTASFKYLGQDTSDRGLLALRPWFPIDVISKEQFLRDNPHFYAYGAVSGWNWLTYDLPQWGNTELLGRSQPEALLFSVDRSDLGYLPPRTDPSAGNSLFQAMPTSGPSLCALSMGAKACL